jgi:LacI family transcriptional regulator
MPVRRVTIDDIARLSEASPTTVSLVLRDKPGIGVETRERVLAAAHSLGYRRRMVRPALDDRQLRTVALFFRARARLADDRFPSVNPFYSWVLTGLEVAARTKRMNLLYATLPVDDQNDVTDIPTHLLEQELDGVLIVGPFSELTLQQMMGGRSVPTVLVDVPARARQFDVVASDNVGGARLIVQHLIDRGHREIGLVAPASRTDPNFRDREEGYRQALAASGLAEYRAEERRGDVAAAVGELLGVNPAVTALFCVNDNYAIQAMKAATMAGRSVPDTLSIVGFDDIDLSSETVPPLTTMSVDKVSMGRLAIELLDFRMSSPDAATVVTTLTPRLVERASVGSPPPRD